MIVSVTGMEYKTKIVYRADGKDMNRTLEDVIDELAPDGWRVNRIVSWGDPGDGYGDKAAEVQFERD